MAFNMQQRTRNLGTGHDTPSDLAGGKQQHQLDSLHKHQLQCGEAEPVYIESKSARHGGLHVNQEIVVL
jgi:hypothetical protein